MVPFVGTVDAAATVLQPLTLSEAEQQAEAPPPETAAAAAAAMPATSVAASPSPHDHSPHHQRAGQPQPAQQPLEPRMSAIDASRPQLDLPVSPLPPAMLVQEGQSAAADGASPGLSLPAAWQPPAAVPPPQPFADQPAQSANAAKDSLQWQQPPSDHAGQPRMKSAVSAQPMREIGSGGEADGPLAPHSRCDTLPFSCF